MSRFLGVLLIALALAIAIVPAYTDCQSQGKSLTLANGKTVPMKCHWTGVAEIAVGVPLAAVGAMMIFSRRRDQLLMLGALASILGILAILLTQDFLIGVCQTPTMLCHTLMRPLLIVLGSLVIVCGLAAAALSLLSGRNAPGATDGTGD